MIITGIHFGVVRSVQVSAQLEVIRGIGKNHIHAVVWKLVQSLDTVALDNRINSLAWRKCGVP